MKYLVLGLSAAAFAVQPVHPAEARDGGAALAAGILGAVMLGAAAAHAQQQPRYVVAPRRRVRQVRPARVVAPVKQAGRTASQRVSALDTSIIRYFYNCNRRGWQPPQAKAENGFVRARASTRNVCGDPNYPVVEYEYAPSSASFAADRVVYRERGRVSFVDNLSLDAAIRNSRENPVLKVQQGGEVGVRHLFSCSDGALPNVAVSARSGFVTVRDATAPACGSQAWPVKEVAYRALNNFVGSDIVAVRSDRSGPLDVPIQVVAAPVIAAPAAKAPGAAAPSPGFKAAPAAAAYAEPGEE